MIRIYYYHLRITYHPLKNPPPFISSELKKYGHHFPETFRSHPMEFPTSYNSLYPTKDL